ncbi:hypothetical protein ISN45_Aa06g011360 [Arabidopsis thaliana x Arabidopsis arenosa]|uniref:Uncharacterized protein n=1 Tax=Arabidopsis thaliana x Arabidopsis arenosa TaxID=1240361 RepID=A0A8T1YW58_9BRAS|nr:hypothetical protein ISN45_Aa06g011360 [Arabidopsis thaliana x Arabidopsis arenosa]
MVPTPNKYKSAHLGRFLHGTAFAKTLELKQIQSNTKNPSLSLYLSQQISLLFEMAISRASIVVLMMVIISVVASAQSEAPAPSPTSGSSAISASFVSAGVAAVAALVFGSALRI